MSRYLPERSFPSYAFIPGENIHPNKEGGHSFGEDEVISSPLSLENKDYLFAIDLINHGYYWEAHVYLEAIWNAHQREGDSADFCKALIKMCAAGVKFKLSSEQAALGHIERAEELFLKVDDSKIDSGISTNDLIKICDKLKDGIFSKIELQLS
ncbi:hypothetical protein BMS_1334 [Halobacteriovorax marinus SJ]|uniref:DUF309 domain-containing protein n=1 Tax=Halobacteriovorax marinus (strain ATCC BAA-682 / DSM 15412 / SJ) TaxID=862908 RepID=E1WZL8_HALMS|nr:DUF309 domain-containing protein [Halobacteriovorax marinus]CBW26204.1 hypothetical protein BMS_1334 [Halobacteriovorax marinus SJ]